MDCSIALHDVNLCHVKEEEQGGAGHSCASAKGFENLGNTTKEALQDWILYLQTMRLMRWAIKMKTMWFLKKYWQSRKLVQVHSLSWVCKEGERGELHVPYPCNWSSASFNKGWNTRSGQIGIPLQGLEARIVKENGLNISWWNGIIGKPGIGQIVLVSDAQVGIVLGL